MISKRIFYISLFSLLLFSCVSKAKDDNNTTKSKEYPVVTIKPKDTLLNIPYVADIQAGRNIEIRPRVDGLLNKIFIKEGQYVYKGQTLFKIDDSALRIELNKAAAAYKSALADARVTQVEVERVQILVNKNIVAKTELDLVNAKYKALLAKVDVALADKNAVQQRIAYTNIKAPFFGIIDRIPLKEGSLVSSLSLLTTISDISSVFAYFNISENEFFQLQHNGHASENIVSINLILPDGTTYPHKGKLESAESEIDEKTGNIAYKVRFANPQKTLRHGASGKLLITRPLQEAILLPQKAVFEIQDKNYVFVVGKDNIARMKNIQVSQRLADYYIVSDGLKPNDRIVYEGIQTIKGGDRIIPREV